MTMEKAKLLRCTFLEPGDILIARMPDPIGRACIFPGSNMPCVTVVDVCIVRPLSSDVDSRWLMHTINSKKFNNNILNFVTGTTRRRISRGNLAKLEIPFPPLPEQKRIAAILDKADSLRRKNQQAIQLADKFLRAVFLDLFGDPVTNPKGWKVQKLRDIALIQIGPFGTQLHKEDYVESGIPLINPTHIVEGKILPNNNLTVTINKHAELSEYHLKIGDIILGRRGEMGRCAVISQKEENWLCGTGSLFIRPQQAGVFSEYLCKLLSGKTIKRYLESESQGATMANLNKTIVGNIDIPIPDSDALTRFSALQEKVLDNLQKHIFSGEQSLFNALSQKAFAGKL
ncbi:MAG TPA: type I restriction endonuclease subunit R [Methylococcaceae bacterium]|nr:type I restriction endonuclease subunit R [Methylococcaceae bacterium]